MKISNLQKTTKDKIGTINKNGVKLEENEESTIRLLALFGFSVEAIQPVSTKEIKNPDVLISGSVWEIKTPISSNKNTIRNRFREASKQAGKIIFDLRYIKNDARKAEKQIIELFKGNGGVRRIMIIRKDDTILDIIK